MQPNIKIFCSISVRGILFVNFNFRLLLLYPTKLKKWLRNLSEKIAYSETVKKHTSQIISKLARIELITLLVSISPWFSRWENMFFLCDICIFGEKMTKCISDIFTPLATESQHNINGQSNYKDAVRRWCGHASCWWQSYNYIRDLYGLFLILVYNV